MSCVRCRLRADLRRSAEAPIPFSAEGNRGRGRKEAAITGTYDSALVALSIVVAVAASFTALELAGRVALAKGFSEPLWLLGGAVVMGSGIWSMHFIGMLAFELPIRMAYDMGLTALSLVIAIGAAGCSLAVVSQHRLRSATVQIGGLMMGLGICAMHYVGMKAMNMVPSIRYAPVPLALSVLIAIGAAYLALWIVFALRDAPADGRPLRRLLGAVVMGLAISGMHYTGMAAATFAPNAYCAVPGNRELDNQLLGYSIGLIMLCLLAISLLLSSAESRILQRTRGMLDTLRKTNQRLREEAVARTRLQRMYAVLSGTTVLIMRTRTRSRLLEGCCEIATDTGGFALAWIGLLRDNTLTPEVVAGRASAALPALKFSLNETDPSRDGPTVRALRSGLPQVCNDVLSEPALKQWHPLFAQHGLNAYVALPLIIQGRVQGCFSLYGNARHSIGEDDLRLLQDVAGHLAHALESLNRDDRLDFLAEHDPLTRLANRHQFRERLSERLLRASEQARPLSLLLLDLRHFSQLNASLGRRGGDQVLCRVAHSLVRYCEADATRVARDTGDRFLVIAHRALDDTSLPALSAEIEGALGNPMRIEHQDVHITLRIGAACYPHDGEDADTLIRSAETALRTARSRQEDAVLHNPRIQEANEVRNQIIQLLPEALNRNELALHYQPKLDCASGAICGAEALLRWQHPRLGRVPPGHFVPVLEESGQIVSVGAWALTQALRDYNRWRVAGLQAPRVAVNVSAIQLRQADFLDTVRNAIAYLPSDLHGLDIEVTESVVMADPEGTARKLRELQGMGMTIAVDDFGTGYSSLAKLTRLPVNYLKIDRSFIVDLERGGKPVDMVAAIIGLAHGLGLKVIAEGVETPAQLRQLQQLGCDQIQGFLFSPGLPADAFAELLASGRRLPVV
jgi:diguanylate cyclase (GGDEF)-like protein